MLSHIVEPRALLMTWQPSDEAAPSRTRRVVGVVRRSGSGSRELTFEYLVGTKDWAHAVEVGFKGYPAFPLSYQHRVFEQGVRDSLMRRLPPASREDFPEFLARHALPYPFHYSEVALLGYTGARLPGDGFALLPDFDPSNLPCEYVMEVAGVRHVYKGAMSLISVGDPIEFVAEPHNKFDSDAIALHHATGKLGYVNRALLPTFKQWMTSGSPVATVERINGKAERPLVFVRVRWGYNRSSGESSALGREA